MRMRPRPVDASTRAIPTVSAAPGPTAALTFTPVVGQFETVLVDGEPMLAFPAGRHAVRSAAPARVTVCVPVFNAGRSLTRCLESVLSQDFADIDVVVIDNGSTDGTLAAACGIAASHPRVVIYQNARNVGRVGNWNQCLTVAQGEFVKLVMVNDVLMPSCIRQLVAVMEAHPRVVLARSSLTLLQQGGRTHFLPLFERSCLMPGTEAIRYCVERGNIAAGPSAQLFRRGAIADRALHFNTGLSWASDYEFATRLLESGDFAYVREPLFVFDETTQRNYATRQPVAELREELAIRLLTVSRHPDLFPSLEPVLRRCAELCRDYVAQATDAAVQGELLALFEQARAALCDRPAPTPAPAPSSAIAPSTTPSTTPATTPATTPVTTPAPDAGVAPAAAIAPSPAAPDVSRFLQLPTTPTCDHGVRRRVCIVSNGISGPTRGGGVARWVAQLAQTLVAAGHDVTVLLARWYPPDDGTFEQWVAEYARRGITLHVLTCRPAVRFHGAPHVIANREVYEWLKRADTFDVIHFNDFEGLGHYTLLAKHQGLGFPETLLCVTVHSPHFYLKQALQQYVSRVLDMEVDFVERRSVELADVVISPSQFMLDWMRSQAWTLPARCYVQQSLVAPAGAAVRPPVAGPQRVTELVFFGLLQELKGLALFCDAVESLLTQRHPPVAVTFLGKEGIVNGIGGAAYLRQRTAAWRVPVTVLTHLHQEEALAYLAVPGRLAVMASRLDNSPYVVMECLEHGIPFLASRVGGIPELVHDDDADRVCYERTPAELTARLRRALHEGVHPARHRIAREDRVRSWLAFHQTIPARRGRTSAVVRPDPSTLPLVTMCITHFNRAALLRQAVASVVAQDYPNLELLIVDDGSTDSAAVACLADLEARAERERRPWRVIRQENRYLGAARNTGVRHARGEFVAFLDDDDIAKPHRISMQVTAAMRTGADIVLAGMDEFTGMEPPAPDQVPAGTWIAIGASLSVGTLQNCFGAVHALVRRSSFLELGGFREVVKVGHEDWEYWARAVHAGQRLEIVPEALNWYRLTPGSMLKTTPQYQNDAVSLQPHLDAVPAGMRPLVQMALGTFRQGITYEHTERWRQGAQVGRTVLQGARLLAARQDDAAASVLVGAVREAASATDATIYLDTLCDVGVLLASTATNRDAGLALLSQAVRLAETIGHARGLETADELLRTMRSVGVVPAPAVDPMTAFTRGAGVASPRGASGR